MDLFRFNRIMAFEEALNSGYSSPAMILGRSLIVAASLLVAVHLPPAHAGSAGEDISFETGRVAIETRTGNHSFEVEIARSAEQRAHGLMYREELPDGHGMLFIYPGEGPVSMWMRNTYLSLDIIFIRADGEIAAIETDAEPLSSALMSSGTPVHGVLEFPAGTTERLGIEVGDRVIHDTFTSGESAPNKNAP